MNCSILILVKEVLWPPILTVSATYSGPDAENMITDLGASAFLALPAEPSRFRQQVAKLVEGQVQSKPLQSWVITTDESEYERVRRIMSERGWHVIRWHGGCQIQSEMPLNAPDIVDCGRALTRSGK